ncbi:hypothetical protein LTR02_005381 [Friedmanniomyces endolithicus]|nr:hypothetical protein LTR02_005381 [Friedmanniomyces endolithicus]
MSPHTITEVVTSQETDDGARQSDLEKLDKSGDTSPTPSICPSEQHRGEKTIVRFADDDPLNPYNWKRSKKLYVVIVSMVMVMNSTIGSSIASGASAETQRYFGAQQFWTEQCLAFHEKLDYDGFWLDVNDATSFCTGSCG